MPATVQIRDHALWIGHIKGDDALVHRLKLLNQDEVVSLEVDGSIGSWQRMRDGNDGRPTYGMKPVGATTEFWNAAQSRRGAWVSIGFADRPHTTVEQGATIAATINLPPQRDKSMLAGGPVLGNYILEAILGQGGFGITYKGRERFTDRAVAIKEYYPVGLATRQFDRTNVGPASERAFDDFQWGLQRFRQEARLLIGMKHPNVVPVLSYFEANGTGYLVMEFQEGRSLGAILRQEGPLTESELLEILEPLLAGLGEVHRQGVLHRDVKPDNILIRSDGSPVLLDFGAARQALSQHSSGFTAILSEGYGPPEQYHSDGEQGEWTDIYALGAVMFHALVGVRPAAAPARVDSKLRSAPDPLARGFEQVRTIVSSHVLVAMERALAVVAGERPQSVAALRDLLWPTSDSTINIQERAPQVLATSSFTRGAGSGYDGKYAPLYDHLRTLKTKEWRATFREVEEALGFKLPISARKYPAWWANSGTSAHPHSQSWLSAGWRTSQVDLGGEKLVFVHSDR